ncbi:MAG: DUF3185 domain-containing protein [Longimicrobiales bacterium]
MRAASIFGIILILAGTAGLVWGGFEYQTEEAVVDAGPLEVEAETTEQVTIPIWVSGVVFLAGIGLVVVGSRKGS